MELFNLIKERFFTVPGIEANEEVQGLKIKEDGTLVLGCMAGPSQEVANLFHEMGHLILCPKERLGQYSWGLYYTNVISIPGYPTFTEPVTCQDVDLELEVIGWQAVLEKEFTGDIKSSLDNVEALVFLGGWLYYQYEETKEIEYSKRDRAKFEFGKSFVKEFASQYSFQEFEQEWNKKLNLIQARLLVEV